MTREQANPKDFCKSWFKCPLIDRYEFVCHLVVLIVLLRLPGAGLLDPMRLACIGSHEEFEKILTAVSLSKRPVKASQGLKLSFEGLHMIL